MKKNWEKTWENDFRMHDGSQTPQNPALIVLREKEKVVIRIKSTAYILTSRMLL